MCFSVKSRVSMPVKYRKPAFSVKLLWKFSYKNHHFNTIFLFNGFRCQFRSYQCNCQYNVKIKQYGVYAGHASSDKVKILEKQISIYNFFFRRSSDVVHSLLKVFLFVFSYWKKCYLYLISLLHLNLALLYFFPGSGGKLVCTFTH